MDWKKHLIKSYANSFVDGTFRKQFSPYHTYIAPDKRSYPHNIFISPQKHVASSPQFWKDSRTSELNSCLQKLSPFEKG